MRVFIFSIFIILTSAFQGRWVSSPPYGPSILLISRESQLIGTVVFNHTLAKAYPLAGYFFNDTLTFYSVYQGQVISWSGHFVNGTNSNIDVWRIDTMGNFIEKEVFEN